MTLALPRPRSLAGVLITLSAMTLAGSGHAAENNDDAPITSYRPSVSTPAQLPVPGQLEFELGDCA